MKHEDERLPHANVRMWTLSNFVHCCVLSASLGESLAFFRRPTFSSVQASFLACAVSSTASSCFSSLVLCSASPRSVVLGSQNISILPGKSQLISSCSCSRHFHSSKSTVCLHDSLEQGQLDEYSPLIGSPRARHCRDMLGRVVCLDVVKTAANALNLIEQLDPEKKPMNGEWRISCFRGESITHGATSCDYGIPAITLITQGFVRYHFTYSYRPCMGLPFGRLYDGLHGAERLDIYTGPWGCSPDQL